MYYAIEEIPDLIRRDFPEETIVIESITEDKIILKESKNLYIENMKEIKFRNETTNLDKFLPFVEKVFEYELKIDEVAFQKTDKDEPRVFYPFSKVDVNNVFVYKRNMLTPYKDFKQGMTKFRNEIALISKSITQEELPNTELELSEFHDKVLNNILMVSRSAECYMFIRDHLFQTTAGDKHLWGSIFDNGPLERLYVPNDWITIIINNDTPIERKWIKYNKDNIYKIKKQKTRERPTFKIFIDELTTNKPVIDATYITKTSLQELYDMFRFSKKNIGNIILNFYYRNAETLKNANNLIDETIKEARKEKPDMGKISENIITLKQYFIFENDNVYGDYKDNFKELALDYSKAKTFLNTYQPTVKNLQNLVKALNKKQHELKNTIDIYESMKSTDENYLYLLEYVAGYSKPRESEFSPKVELIEVDQNVLD